MSSKKVTILIVLLAFLIGLLLGSYLKLSVGSLPGISDNDGESGAPKADPRIAEARKGDERIKSSLESIWPKAEEYYKIAGTYGDQFPPSQCLTSQIQTASIFTSPAIQKIMTDAALAAGNGLQSVRCSTNGTQYAISVRLKTDGSRAWCVDSAGFSGEIAILTWTGSSCPQTAPQAQ